MRGARIRTLALALAGVSATGLATPFATAAHAQDANRRNFNIPAQDMAGALEAFGRQSGRDILFDRGQVASLRSRAVRGSLEPGDALRRLVGNSGLSVRAPNGATFVVSRGSAEANTASSSGVGAASAEAEQEIVVTGTNIRNARGTASHIESFDRDSMDAAGQHTIKDFVLALPQNFGGVANEDTNQNIAGGAAAGQNQTAGTGVNLRGMGPEATLTLLDGHRIAPANISGNFADISLIPSGAIERIDVLLDGASAIYGSDAVGGVVNFRMRRNFNGSETRAMVGTATGGGDHELLVSQTLGREWVGGSGLISYEYFDRSDITASDRDFTSGATEPTTLLPEQTRHSVYANIVQEVASNVTLSADGLYANRSSAFSSNSPVAGVGTSFRPRIELFSGSLTADIQLGAQNVVLGAAYSAVDAKNTLTSTQTGAAVGSDDTQTEILSLDARVSGALFEMPGGPVRYAVGGQFRHESFSTQGFTFSATGFEVEREIFAAFAELDAPLWVGGPNSFVRELRFNAAARWEDYSDFGETLNPKVGVTLQLGDRTFLRGTYSTAFRAPLLVDLNPNPFNVVLRTQIDPTIGGGQTPVLLAYGGNPDLEPEKAEIWTAGISVDRRRASGFSASIDYYHIRFDGRISNLDLSGCRTFSRALRECEPRFGPPLLIRHPSLAQLQEIVGSAALFTDLTGGTIPLSSVSSNGALIDGRQFNLSTFETDGIDLNIAYRFAFGADAIEIGLNATKILSYDRRIVSGDPLVSLLDSPNFPVSTRLRLRGIAEFADWRIGLFISYTDGYSDNRVSPEIPIDSYTSTDLSITYTSPAGAGALRDFQVTLSVRNLFDEEPPFVRGSSSDIFPGINYDATNASAVGRFVSLMVSKRF